MHPEAVDSACVLLDPPLTGGGALAWLHAGTDFSIEEIDELGDQLNTHLAQEALLVISVVVHPDWHEGLRALSLTVVGNWS